MKLLRYLLIATVALMPLFASASTIPTFPMALWGKVTVNGNAAPVGTIIRAYYGSRLAGQVTVNDAGVYGYTEPTKQKLILGEGTGTISFTVQSVSYNSGAETAGATPVTYPQFTSGTTANIDLAFAIPDPQTNNTGSSGSNSGGNGSGGGGGGSGSTIPSSGGGGGGYITPITTPVVTITSATTTQATTTTASVPAGVVLGESAYNFTQNLRVGSTGEDVTELQNILIAEGFLATAPTGYFGNLTRVAVKLYQAKYGISQVGTVGPLTRAQLNKGYVATAPTVQTTAVSTSVGFVFTRALSLGSRSSDVSQLQKVLINLGLLNSEVTGYYGPLTKKAVIAYQARFGISQTGTVGPITRAQLNK